MTVKRKKRICVYCGSQFGQSPKYTELAQRLADLLVAKDWDLVYGGGRVGLMGVVSQRVLESGGEVHGVIPDGLFAREVADQTITKLYVVGSMHERKALMENLSDAFIAIPGGWGTMDEFFEIITWRQLGLHQKPVILLNEFQFYQPLIEQINQMVTEGFVQAKHLETVRVVDSLHELEKLL